MKNKMYVFETYTTNLKWKIENFVSQKCCIERFDRSVLYNDLLGGVPELSEVVLEPPSELVGVVSLGVGVISSREGVFISFTDEEVETVVT